MHLCAHVYRQNIAYVESCSTEVCLSVFVSMTKYPRATQGGKCIFHCTACHITHRSWGRSLEAGSDAQAMEEG